MRNVFLEFNKDIG